MSYGEIPVLIDKRDLLLQRIRNFNKKHREANVEKNWQKVVERVMAMEATSEIRYTGAIITTSPSQKTEE